MAFETRKQWQRRVDELVRRADTDDVPQPKPEQPIVGSSDGFTLGPDVSIPIPEGQPQFEMQRDAALARIADAVERIAKSLEVMAAKE